MECIPAMPAVFCIKERSQLAHWEKLIFIQLISQLWLS